MSSITVTPLGAGQDVGRSCLLVCIGGKRIMLDCGMYFDQFLILIIIMYGNFVYVHLLFPWISQPFSCTYQTQSKLFCSSLISSKCSFFQCFKQSLFEIDEQKVKNWT